MRGIFRDPVPKAHIEISFNNGYNVHIGKVCIVGGLTEAEAVTMAQNINRGNREWCEKVI